jgi:hypothetical protein
MSYFQRQADTLEEQQTEQHEQPRASGSRLADLGDRIARAFTGFDRGRIDQLSLEQGEEADQYDVLADVPSTDEDSRFPLGRPGYDRAAVDEHIAELERELGELREAGPTVSINEEIERLGEQTASILVVAHDQAQETTRLAQQQADRCIADAASNAVAITERAKQQLGELDSETDAVWRERTRLLEDARAVGVALIALAEEAAERFPEDIKPADTQNTGD